MRKLIAVAVIIMWGLGIASAQSIDCRTGRDADGIMTTCTSNLGGQPSTTVWRCGGNGNCSFRTVDNSPGVETTENLTDKKIRLCKQENPPYTKEECDFAFTTLMPMRCQTIVRNASGSMRLCKSGTVFGAEYCYSLCKRVCTGDCENSCTTEQREYCSGLLSDKELEKTVLAKAEALRAEQEKYAKAAAEQAAREKAQQEAFAEIEAKAKKH